MPDDDLNVRLGRIRDGGRQLAGRKSFVAQVLTAARRAGHTGYGRAGQPGRQQRSRFGRGNRFAAAVRQMSRTDRRVVIKARIVRHHGAKFRSAQLSKHLVYLKREGVTRDGQAAAMFDRETDQSDDRAFASRCEEDRHHFRFIVSPEDAPRLEDFRAFTRDLMATAERDLGTRLDWVAVDHWNTDQPHVHVLVRGRSEDGSDLVIARDYISRGLRARAEELVTLELGPRSERELRASLDAEIGAERWTGLDQALRALADEHAGQVDLRPGPHAPEPELRRRLVGRAQTLERLGVAERFAPAVWELRADAEATLRDLGMRGDIIKTMHRAVAGHGERAAGDFAIDAEPAEPIIGRLAARGLHDELSGTAYVVIDGVDGRIHHLRLADIDRTGDTPVGGIVEVAMRPGQDGALPQLRLLGRSDLAIAAQVEAAGATWLDRLQVARDPTPLAASGFGHEVRDALERRAEHLVAEGLARRAGQRVVFARDLLQTLRQRELDATAARLAAQTGLPHRPAHDGDAITGTYRQRLDLASGRFAMIDGGLGFQLVPWRPALDQHLGREVSGTITPGGDIDWSLGRKRGLGV
jgi:type IV secretory pathway VirD2 relaxase